MEEPSEHTSSNDEDHALLAAAFVASSSGICFFDLDGRILKVNTALCRMLGYSADQLVGQPWTLIAPQQVAVLGTRYLESLAPAGTAVPSEWKVARRDGTQMTGLVSLHPLTLEDGRRRIVATFNDIELHRSAKEGALRRTRDLYRDVVENVSEAIAILQDGRLIYANPRAVSLSGYTADELLQLPFSELVHPDDREQTMYLYQCSTAGIPAPERHTDFRVVRRDARVVWVESSAVRIDWEGQPATLAFFSDQTERRRQQEALVKSEEHHRQVVDHATEGIVVVQDGAIVFANSRMRELCGYPPEQLQGKSILALIHPEDHAHAGKRYGALLSADSTDSTEHIESPGSIESATAKITLRALNRVAHTYVWLEVAIVTIEWEGRPATLSFLTDITERKALEDRLKQSLDERETILDNAIVGMVFLNASGRVQWANNAVFDIFRIDRAEWADPSATSLESFYPSREAYLETGAKVVEAVRTGKAFEAEMQMKRGDGSLFWAYVSGRAVNHADLWRGTVWAVMDISQRRALEAALNKSEEHYRQVVDNVTECILVVQDGHIVLSNPRLTQLIGFTQQELAELPFATAIHPEDRSLVIDRHVRRLRGEEVEQYYQFRVVHRRTRAVVWVQLSAVMIEWEGRPATLSFMTDITERKRLEDSLKQSMAERIRLETLQIHGELKEAELARRHAEETTRAKSMFLANMSHEIRTPMNAIIGMAHLVLRSGLDAKQREYVEKIHAAGLSLLGIINDILDFSKVEAGKLDMERVAFSLDDVFANVAAVTAVKAHEKRIEYLFQCPLDVPRALVGDPLRLGQVLINLINNAVKFTERGEVQVACRCLDLGATQVQLQFVVRDTGIGMPAEQAQRLFQPFSQADESTTRRYGGTGLGLSIAKRLVELMDGAIWLESAPGIGTTIRFTAWFGLGESAQPDIVLPAHLRAMRVLVVDDHPGALAACADSLAALQLQVEQAASAVEALHRIHQADADVPFGLVVTDQQMEGMDGIELINAVKSDETLNAAPRMLLLLSDASEDTRTRTEQVAADGWLMKPVHAAQMAQALHNLYAPHCAESLADAARRGEPPQRFKDLVILLVEDNEINQQVAGEMMRAAGIVVEIATNGRVALDMLSAAPQRYGLVFMDVQMPEMDGYEATRRIRADARFNALPVVALTAHALLEERERCFAAGMNGHLAKPVSPAHLLRTIARWCPRHLIAPAAQQAEAPDEADGADALLSRIEGLDVKAGLARALGDRDFYVTMLSRFRESQQDAAAGIRTALQQDRDIAQRLAHTLRGVAGLLGASQIQQLSAALEDEIHDGSASDALQPLLDELDTSLSNLHAAIDHILPAVSPVHNAAGKLRASPVTADGGKPDDSPALLAQLASLLRESDADATELIASSRVQLKSSLGSERFAALERAAHQYDFDAALAALESGPAGALSISKEP